MCRLDLNDPPTAVGGIQGGVRDVCVGWIGEVEIPGY